MNAKTMIAVHNEEAKMNHLRRALFLVFSQRLD
jgi:hypothetical protein